MSRQGILKFSSTLSGYLKQQYGSGSNIGALHAMYQRWYATFAGDVKYAESHEWVKVDGNIATIGISDHAQSELGDIVFVELPKVGDDVEATKEFAVVESVKTASDIYSPVSGKVVEVNQGLGSEPQKINESAFGDGWLAKVEMSRASEVDGLLSMQEYKDQCES